MTAIEFLKNEIDKLVKKIPLIKCTYEYNENSSVHFISVSPLNLYNSNEAYIDAESEIVFSFIKNFPLENISFIGEDSLVKIKKPIYHKNGDFYDYSSLLPVLNQSIQQISPTRKMATFDEVFNTNIAFWSEEKNQNQVLNEVNYAGNTSFAMAA
jgi:hypothetical protein